MKSNANHVGSLSWVGAIASIALISLPAIASSDLESTIAETGPNQTTSTRSEGQAVQILSPIAENILNANETSVTVQSPTQEELELRVNGVLIDSGQIGQTIVDPAQGLKTDIWYDISFRSGKNTISVHRVGDPKALQSIQVYKGSKAIRSTEKPQEKSAMKPIAIVSPKPDEVIGQPATAITVRMPVNEEIELRINGDLVDEALLGRTATDTVSQLVQKTWYGVILESGNNTITLNRVGDPELLESVQVQVRGEPSAIQLTTLKKSIPADGRSTIVIQGELLDDNKNRSDWNAVVTLNATEGTFVDVDQNPDASGFQVKAVNGRFTATLQSSLESGPVRVQAKSNELEGFHQFDFTTPLRPAPLITGVVDFRFGSRGTNYYDSLREFLPPGDDDDLDADAKIAAFGTASLGEWLITGAVNSDRTLNEDCNGETSLFRAVGDCSETLYPTYGDNSTSEIVAPSKDHLFLKIERSSRVSKGGIDYFMWGDYNTKELNRSSQQFSGIGRDLHGFKGNFNLGKLQITGLYGNNADGFQRDTIAPDGTSGYYFLSRRLLVPGSEEIYLELEELNRPGTVLQRERLNRGADYDIDYDRGTILFRKPILRTDIDDDGKVLVRRIVSTYEYESEGATTDIIGGRLQYHFSQEAGQESWLGSTYFREDRGDQNFELYGADAQVSFGKDGKFIAEYARSRNSLDYGDRVSGDAYRAEVSGTLFDKVKGRAYYRTTDEGFSNNATTSFVAGQTRYGAEVDAKVAKKTTLRFSYDHEDNFGVAPEALDQLEELIQPGTVPEPGTPVDNSLTTIRAGVLQKIGKASLGVDWVHRDRDNVLTDERVISDQLSTTFKMPVTKKLSLHAYNDLTLSSNSDPLYPSRTTVGLDWRLHPAVSLTFDNTLFSGGDFDGDVITSLGLKGNHTFSTDTTLRGELTMLGNGLNARGMGGRFGVDQGLTLARGLEADFSYEYVFSEDFTTAAGEQFIQPFAVGPGASALTLTDGHSFSAGINYTDNPDFKASARVEHRTNSKGSNTVISANALGQMTRDLTGLVSFKQASAANQALSDLGVSRDIKVGLAFRNPTDDTFNGLLRYEFRQNPAIIPETLLLGRGTGSESHLLAVEGIYAPSWRWELYGKAGFRHSKTNLAQNFTHTNTTPLAQFRATHRLNYQWDISAEARWIGQPSAGYDEFGVNAEVGFYLNPNIRLSAGYAFGDINDRDLGNSRSSDGPYLGVTLKLDNNLFKDFGFQKPSVPQQQESRTEIATQPSSGKKSQKRQIMEPKTQIASTLKEFTEKHPRTVAQDSLLNQKSTSSKSRKHDQPEAMTPIVEVENEALYALRVVKPEQGVL